MQKMHRQKSCQSTNVLCQLTNSINHQSGFCRNPGYPTIEEELLKAFKEAGTICDEWFETPQKGHFQRASRTDKGVSAARMVISLKFRKYIKCRTVE